MRLRGGAASLRLMVLFDFAENGLWSNILRDFADFLIGLATHLELLGDGSNHFYQAR